LTDVAGDVLPGTIKNIDVQFNVDPYVNLYFRHGSNKGYTLIAAGPLVVCP
jgi:hypothetical protein